MELNVKHLATVAVTLAIMVVLVASVLIPVLSEAQKVSGDLVEYSNEDLRFADYAYYRETNTVSAHIEGTSATIGDFSLPMDNTYRLFMMADTFCVVTHYGSSSVAIVRDGPAESRESYTGIVDIVCEGGVCTITHDSTTLTIDYGDLFVVCPSENATHVGLNVGSLGGAHFNSSELDLIVYADQASNHYLFYSNGEVSTVGDYLVTADLTAPELVEGTTDVWAGATLTFNIDGTARATGNTIVPIEVTGHKDSGASYSLIGVIPILILTGLVIGVVGSFIRNRD